jgi:hypothetical protein
VSVSVPPNFVRESPILNRQKLDPISFLTFDFRLAVLARSGENVMTSSIFITGLSYVNTSGAGSSINIETTSPIVGTINKSEEVFLAGATSNKATVAVTNSFIRVDKNDLLLGGKGNNALDDLSTDTLTKGGDTDLFLLKTATYTPSLADRGDKVAMGASNIVPKGWVFRDFHSTSDIKIDSNLVPSQDSFLGNANSFYF